MAKLDSSDSGLPGRLVHALSHPIRVRVLERLAREDSSASRLAEAFDEPVPTVAYHLCRVLFKECDLVEVVERHQRRGTEERVFALKPGPYSEVIRFSTAAIVAFEAEVREPTESRLCTWHSVAVDERGRDEIELAMRALAETVRAAGERCADSDPDELCRLTVGSAAFDASRGAAAQPRSVAAQT
jgi:DNA-binding transcriptional ArsR family regulator